MITCSGQCCSVFTFQDTTEIADRFAKGEGYEDDYKLLTMLEPIPVEEAQERVERFGVTGNYAQVVHNENPPEFYKCRLWDEETRLCTQYEDRPRMCRTYPYGRGCHHGCTFEVDVDYLAEEGWITPQQWMERGYKWPVPGQGCESTTAMTE